MKGRGAVAWFSLLMLSLAVLVPTPAVAHDAGTFTVIIKSHELTPTEPHLIYNDSVWWYNADDSENITHRIVYDADGDGLYNGTNDWDSGELYYECERDENNSKIDEDCEITYEITFNSSTVWGAGVYHYQDLISNGTVRNGTISVASDAHNPNEEPPPINYEFNTEDEENNSEVAGESSIIPREILFWIAAISGLGAVVVLVLIVMGDDDEVLSTSSDRDIEEIAEEE